MIFILCDIVFSNHDDVYCRTYPDEMAIDFLSCFAAMGTGRDYDQEIYITIGIQVPASG